MKPYCARPNRQHHLSGPSPKGPTLRREFDPAIADFGFRAPLLPHLARQYAKLFGYRALYPPNNEKSRHCPTLGISGDANPARYHACPDLPGGEGGIRTHGRVTPTLHFQCSLFVHSSTSPNQLCRCSSHMSTHYCLSGGEGGIRTHGAHKCPTVFETATFNHSVTSPFAASSYPAAPGKTLA